MKDLTRILGAIAAFLILVSLLVGFIGATVLSLIGAWA